MAINMIPYLIFDGNAKEAIAFYEKALNAENLGVITFGEMPEDPNYPLPAEAKDRVSHATLKVGNSDLMFSDTFPGQPYQTGNNVTICITCDDPTRSKEMFATLEQGGQVTMPLMETSFSPLYGMVVDKYGVTFQIYTEHAR